MSKPARINRRQWLKAAGATAAGVVLAGKLAGADRADGAAKAFPLCGTAPPLPEVEQGERRYIHGFEPYPGT